MDLEDRVALVTGADRGIGRAIAFELARAGVHVAVAFHSQRADAEAVAREIRSRHRRAAVVQADVGVEADVARMVADSAAAVGEIDVRPDPVQTRGIRVPRGRSGATRESL